MAVVVSTDQDFKNTLDTNAKVIVKYYADWCGSCKLFSPKYKRLSNDERFTNVVFLDINAEENEAARKLAGVDNLPFFATFNQGELVESSASSKEEVVVKMIENLLSK
ncbi:thioredoxin family protein [Solitalea sp. MAHUQ-68]|uniref:Thioredoxin family protein n=1 Tax=Solitalea agri TaxID=2953739 RepID=A0A9X2F6Z2_9SPHI|nr:thioredoxin family protein [Solitalea agri]MCO4291853.1 thioredoxin family protein [Solitalea agri]